MEENKIEETSVPKNADTLWDIDESTTFENAFDMTETADPDPILDFDKKLNPVEDKAEEIKEETKEEKPEELVGNLDDESKDTEETSESPDFDPEAVSTTEVDTEDNTIDEDNPVAVFASMLNEKEIIELNDDFEATEEGLLEAVEGTVESRVKEELDLFQNSLTKEGRELLKHLINGGKVSDFVDTYSQLGFEEVDISKSTNQKYVLREFMKLRGDSEEEIRENMELYEDNGILAKKAQVAQQRLAAYQDQRKQKFAEEQQRAARQKEDKRKEIVTNIQETISKSEEIKGIPLSKKAKKQLLSYMTVPTVKINDPSGGVQYVTQFQADEAKSSNNLDEFILKAYLRMTDYDLSSAKKRSVTDFSSKLRTSLQNKKSLTDTKAKFGGNKKVGGKSSVSWDL
ncbi:MAG: hypothetical protein GOVbin1709_16 [Prokaryotic dsDNA virus sp.]|nr:MAG: hypothetical protein GOVbin1709_16 [Prokaryotic dsDNA virus sp.]|tara:strand:+ start:7714 stop:8916 length:1203 start_codon:yes stop_codon:yes gene_type:complete